MTPQPWWTWIAHASGWVFAAAGVSLLLWALFWDRSRGRRRCAKCWYELGGAPGLKCPECGREAASEQSLLRTRRRKRPAAAAMLVLVLAYAMGRAPDVARHGWLEFAPTTLLAGLAPAEREMRYLGGVARMKKQQPETLKEWWTLQREELGDVMRRRLRDEQPWRWQARWYIRRVLRAEPPDLRSLVVVPPRWPRGEPIPAFAGGLSQWDTGIMLDGCLKDARGRWQGVEIAKLPACRTNEKQVEVRAGLSYRGHRMWEQTVTRPIVITGLGAECLLRESSEELNQHVRAALRPKLWLSEGGGLRLMVHDRTEVAAWWKIECGVYVRLEVRADGEMIGRGSAQTAWGWPVDRETFAAHMNWEPGAHQRLCEPGTRVTIVATGDPDVAWLRYRDNPFSKSSAACWAGRFEVQGTLGEVSEPPEERR